MTINIIEFMLFLIYTILIFFIKSYFILGIMIIINIILMIMFKQKISNNILEQMHQKLI